MKPYQFWYTYPTTGNDGFLLDVIRRPEEAVARLAVFRAGRPPRVLRRGFDTSELNGVPGKLGVRLNRIVIDAGGCRGDVGGVDLAAQFALSGRGMGFVPQAVSWWFDRVPDFRSRYGVAGNAVCDRVSYRDVPFVCSTYSLYDLAGAKWLLVSAPRFPGSDLAFEISATRLFGRWMATAWLYFGGREYHYESPLDSLFSVGIGRTGEVAYGERVITAKIRGKGLGFEIEARADTREFARLDSYRQTDIHTTLFASCKASGTAGAAAGQTFAAARTCLLEVKS
jgi:hypothetical protein